MGGDGGGRFGRGSVGPRFVSMGGGKRVGRRGGRGGAALEGEAQRRAELPVLFLSLYFYSRFFIYLVVKILADRTT